MHICFLAGLLSLVLCVAGSFPAPSRPKTGDYWRWLNCVRSEEWSSFRERLCQYRQVNFPPDAKLWRVAVQLLARRGQLVKAERFASALARPMLYVQHADDCMYGKVTALFVRGLGYARKGMEANATFDWSTAVAYLAFAHSLDLLESTGWCVRSADILHALGSPLHSLGPFHLNDGTYLPPKVSYVTQRQANQGPRAVDASCALWPCGEPLPTWPLGKPLPSLLKVALFSSHLAIVEPVATLLLGGAPRSAPVEMTWYGASGAFNATLTSLSPGLRLRAGLNCDRTEPEVWNEQDEIAVREVYRDFVAENSPELAESDLCICLKFCDCFHLWHLLRRPVMWLSAIYWLIPDGSTPYSYQQLLKQFLHFFKNDVVQHAKVRADGLPGTVSLALNTYAAEWLLNPMRTRLPFVRPLALYVRCAWQPNATEGRLRVLVIPGRRNTHRFEVYLSAIQETRRLLGNRLLQIVIPLTQGPAAQTLGGMSYQVVSRFSAFVLLPWGSALTVFREVYAMGVPTFLPDVAWLARLWSYESENHRPRPWAHTSTKDWLHPHPLPPAGNSVRYWPEMLYWPHYYDDCVLLPGVTLFPSLSGLFLPLAEGRVDLPSLSKKMAGENARALDEVYPFWASVISDLVSFSASHSG